MLLLQDDATIERVIPNSTLPAYLKKHHIDWTKQAQAMGLDTKRLSLVLVNGTVKTTQWTVAAFQSTEKGQSTDVQGRFPSFGNIAFAPSSNSKDANCVEYRSGLSLREGHYPSPIPSSTAPNANAHQPTQLHPRSVETSPTATAQLQNDQCIFLQYYQIKYRVFPRHIVPGGVEAATSRHKLSGAGGDGDSVPVAPAVVADVDVGDVSLP